MENQKDTCVFANRVGGTECSALNKYFCEVGDCAFYKSREEYALDENGYCYKKSEGSSDDN